MTLAIVNFRREAIFWTIQEINLQINWGGGEGRLDSRTSNSLTT